MISIDKDPDFRLIREELVIPGLRRTYTLMHITDAHLCPDSELDDAETRKRFEKSRRQWRTPSGESQEQLLYRVLAYAREAGVDLVCCTGDMMEGFSEGSFACLRETMCEAPAFLYAMGNHENSQTFGIRYAEWLGENSGLMCRDLGELLVVQADNASHCVGEAECRRLEALLNGEKPVILLQHIPMNHPSLYPVAEKHWGQGGLPYFLFGHSGNWDGKDAYYDLLTQQKTALRAILCGHLHLAHRDVFENGVVQMVADTCFSGYARLLTVRGS